MAVVVKISLPGINREVLEELSRRMGVQQDPPQGLIVHTGTEANGGVEVLDVWESREDFENFSHTRLGPTIAALAQERRMALPEGGPNPEILPTFDLLRGRA